MAKRRFFTKKRIIWTVIILAIIIGAWYQLSKGKDTTSGIQTTVVSRQDLKQTVLTTGQVVSQTTLSLSFQGSGVVDKVNVAASDHVKAGDVLAMLNSANAQAALTSAQGALAQAEANYQKVLAGSSREQINVSQKSVDAARVAYNNAISQLANIKQTTDATISQDQKTLDDLQSPDTQADNKRSAIITVIANQLAGVKSALDKENQILNDNNLKNTFSITDSASLVNFKNANQLVQPLLNTANSSLAAAASFKSDANINQAIGDALNVLNQNLSALNYCFSALQNSVTSSNFTQTQLDTYKAGISGYLSDENPGVSTIKSAQQDLTDALTAAGNALTNASLSATQQITTAQNQISSAQAALQQAQATLAQQQAAAQPADINSAKAQILSAQGQVDAAQAALDNLTIKAPADGTITEVDTKVGEQANALQEVMILQDINNLHTESYVSEANVASLQPGQPVDYTFDALGPDRHFSGKILTIDPASTVISGVVDYLVKADLPSIADIKPGMTVNMTILVASKNQVLALPASAVISGANGQQSVRVIDDTQKKTYHSVTVQTGLSADGGLIEITSGLQEGQEIVTYIKPQ